MQINTMPVADRLSWIENGIQERTPDLHHLDGAMRLKSQGQPYERLEEAVAWVLWQAQVRARPASVGATSVGPDDLDDPTKPQHIFRPLCPLDPPSPGLSALASRGLGCGGDSQFGLRNTALFVSHTHRLIFFFPVCCQSVGHWLRISHTTIAINLQNSLLVISIELVIMCSLFSIRARISGDTSSSSGRVLLVLGSKGKELAAVKRPPEPLCPFNPWSHSLDPSPTSPRSNHHEILSSRFAHLQIHALHSLIPPVTPSLTIIPIVLSLLHGGQAAPSCQSAKRPVPGRIPVYKNGLVPGNQILPFGH
ncbi:hypothetical protein GGR52DRAFT_15688 [Hypoxylon sp. FL1284]|nr:hypothetical protein GGR52DRAFT_15688 [Hypoxylon sp. FL1284]